MWVKKKILIYFRAFPLPWLGIQVHICAHTAESIHPSGLGYSLRAFPGKNAPEKACPVFPSMSTSCASVSVRVLDMWAFLLKVLAASHLSTLLENTSISQWHYCLQPVSCKSSPTYALSPAAVLGHRLMKMVFTEET